MDENANPTERLRLIEERLASLRSAVNVLSQAIPLVVVAYDRQLLSYAVLRFQEKIAELEKARARLSPFII